MTDFKPGDVALVTIYGKEHLALRRGGAWTTAYGHTDAEPRLDEVKFARRLVVIDAEDREDVERLIEVMRKRDWTGLDHEAPTDMQAALREFAIPTPPRPDEPTGLYAVVIDDEGNAWHRNHDCDSKKPWRKATGFWFTWDDISVSSDDQIKFQGITP